MTISDREVLLGLTTSVIEVAAPEERSVLDAPGFPYLAHSSVPKGPLGIGFEAAFLLVAPMIYLFFETLLREGAKAAATKGITRLFRGKRLRIPSEREVTLFFESRGLDPETSEKLMHHILLELDRHDGDRT